MTAFMFRLRSCTVGKITRLGIQPVQGKIEKIKLNVGSGQPLPKPLLICEMSVARSLTRRIPFGGKLRPFVLETDTPRFHAFVLGLRRNRASLAN